MGILPNTWHTQLGWPDSIEVAPPATDGGGSSSVNLLALNDFEFGTNGALVTAAAVASAEQGTAWTWAQSRTPLGHTRISTSGNDNFTLPATIAGGSIATNGTRRLEFNLTEAISDGLTPVWERLTATAPAGIRRIVVCGFIELSIADDVERTAMDLWELHGGPYLTAQLVRNGFFSAHGEGTAGEIHCETQADGGVTTRSLAIPVNADTVYFMEACWDNVTGSMGIIIRDSTQSVLIGATGLVTNDATNTDLDSLFVQDYVTFFGGYIRHDKLSRVWGPTVGFPLFPLTIPSPSSLVLTQNLPSQIDVTWTAKAIGFKIERSSNAGSSWSTLETYIEALDVRAGDGTDPVLFSYSDTTVVNGSTYRYRLTSIIGSSQSTAATSTDLTVDNSVTPVATDNFAGIGFGSPLHDRTNWDAFNDLSQSYGYSGSTVQFYQWSGGPGVNPSIDYNTSVAATQDQRAEITLVAYQNVGGGPAVRCQSGSQSCYSLRGNLLSTAIDLIKVVSGTLTVITSVAVVPADGMKLAIEALGTGAATRLYAWYDIGSGWVSLFSAVDPGATYLDGGRWGVCGTDYNGSSNTFDDWKAFNFS